MLFTRVIFFILVDFCGNFNDFGRLFCYPDTDPDPGGCNETDQNGSDTRKIIEKMNIKKEMRIDNIQRIKELKKSKEGKNV